MDAEQFRVRAGVDAALHEQMKVSGPVTDETLAGCLMAAVQLGAKLRLTDEQFLGRVRDELRITREYLDTKAAVRKGRK